MASLWAARNNIVVGSPFNSALTVCRQPISNDVSVIKTDRIPRYILIGKFEAKFRAAIGGDALSISCGDPIFVSPIGVVQVENNDPQESILLARSDFVGVGLSDCETRNYLPNAKSLPEQAGNIWHPNWIAQRDGWELLCHLKFVSSLHNINRIFAGILEVEAYRLQTIWRDIGLFNSRNSSIDFPAIWIKG